MKSKYDKIRHIQETNQSLEKRVLLERKNKMFENQQRLLTEEEEKGLMAFIDCVKKDLEKRGQKLPIECDPVTPENSDSLMSKILMYLPKPDMFKCAKSIYNASGEVLKSSQNCSSKLGFSLKDLGTGGGITGLFR